MINLNDKIKMIKDLTEEYKLGWKGQNLSVWNFW